MTTLVSSRDGRTFTLGSALTSDLVATTPGDLLLIRTAAGEVLVGQVTADGAGLLVGTMVDTGLEGGFRKGQVFAPFADATADGVDGDTLAALQDATGSGLTIGTWSAGATTGPARLRAGGFNRHTFLCGQSGSGKTYALGVLLEQLMLGTSLRMVVLDPNADFVRLGETRAGTSEADASALAGVAVRVLAAQPGEGVEPLRARFATMSRQAQAAVLRMDPLADREEYNTFLHTFADRGPVEVQAAITLLSEGTPAQQHLAMRLENLGVMAWETWAGTRLSAAEVVAEGPRVTVCDLSGFRDPVEPEVVALDLVESLWAQRTSRTPTLLVIDEAHNICPAEPRDAVQQAVVDRLVQIAAEGRKYGLWLLLSTQRPSKIHPQVLSQCDNLMLMRMNSPGDVAELVEVFGFAPPAMIGAAPFFTQGEALMAGAFAPLPMRVRMGARLTVEGGSDVHVPQ